MAQLCDHHKKLTNGVGKCSVPMWMNGGPAGFCDQPAFGERPDGTTHRRWDGFEWRDDGRYPGYIPALACPQHGGPPSIVEPATAGVDSAADWIVNGPDPVLSGRSVAEQFDDLRKLRERIKAQTDAGVRSVDGSRDA